MFGGHNRHGGRAIPAVTWIRGPSWSWSLHCCSDYDTEPRITLRIALVSLLSRAFLVAQMVKNLPALQETWVRYLGQ